MQIGVNWYGRPLFNISEYVHTGENKLKISYTSVLANYARSLKDNPAAQRWTENYNYIPMGLEGSVLLYSDADGPPRSDFSAGLE